MGKGRNEQVARVIAEINLLRSCRYGLTTQQIYARISEDFNVSLRTVYRDLEAIEMAGYVLQHVPTENAKTWASRWAIKDGAVSKESRKMEKSDLDALKKIRFLLGEKASNSSELNAFFKRMLPSPTPEQEWMEVG